MGQDSSLVSRKGNCFRQNEECFDLPPQLTSTQTCLALERQSGNIEEINKDYSDQNLV
jgi:hypothetical protein